MAVLTPPCSLGGCAGTLGSPGSSHQPMWERPEARTGPRPWILCSGLAGSTLNLPSNHVWDGDFREKLLQVRLALGGQPRPGQLEDQGKP